MMYGQKFRKRLQKRDGEAVAEVKKKKKGFGLSVCLVCTMPEKEVYQTPSEQTQLIIDIRPQNATKLHVTAVKVLHVLSREIVQLVDSRPALCSRARLHLQLFAHTSLNKNNTHTHTLTNVT